MTQCNFYREAKNLMQIILLEHFPIGIESLESLYNQSSSLFSTTRVCVCVCIHIHTHTHVQMKTWSLTILLEQDQIRVSKQD